MAFQRTDPLRDLLRLQDRMNSLFEETLARGAAPGEPEALAGFRPPLDLHDAGAAYVLQADLPGVEPGEVDVHVEDGRLVLRGERRIADVGDAGWLRRERPHGRFLVHVALPPSVDPQGIRASQRNGVLEVRLPKKRAETVGRIPVSAD